MKRIHHMEDTYLTPHFRLSEFTRSATAQARGIDNTPTEEIVSNLRHLCENVLEPLRQHFGEPITISSGYRSAALNRAVGGASNSQHMTGEAADIRVPDSATGMKWFAWMMEHLEYDQLIKERATNSSRSFWIHVSLKAHGQQRQHVICNLIKNQS